MSLMILSNRINEIGRSMVACNYCCPIVALDPHKGILPRCLISEIEGRDDGRGSIIVGMNPGRSKEPERKFYRDNGQTYEQVIAYWTDHIGYRHKYYRQLRALVTELGLR